MHQLAVLVVVPVRVSRQAEPLCHFPKFLIFGIDVAPPGCSPAKAFSHPLPSFAVSEDPEYFQPSFDFLSPNNHHNWSAWLATSLRSEPTPRQNIRPTVAHANVNDGIRVDHVREKMGVSISETKSLRRRMGSTKTWYSHELDSAKPKIQKSQ